MKSRMVGRTQLYKLNRKNKMTVFLLKNFEESLKMVFDKKTDENQSHTTESPRVFAMGARPC